MNLLTRFFSNTKVKYDVMNKLLSEIEARDDELQNQINVRVTDAELTEFAMDVNDELLSRDTKISSLETKANALEAKNTAQDTAIANKVDSSTFEIDKAALEDAILTKLSNDEYDADKLLIDNNITGLKATDTSLQADINTRVQKTAYAIDKAALESAIAAKTTSSLNGVSTNVNFISDTTGVKAINGLDIVGNKMITTEKTTFFETGKNLFNKNTRLIGKYISSTDGILQDANIGYDSSDYIFIDETGQYVMNYGGQWAEYDKDKQFIVGHPSSVLTVMLNENTRYVRISIHQTNVDAFQFEKGNASTVYENYKLKIKSTSKEPITLLNAELENEFYEVNNNINEHTIKLGAINDDLYVTQKFLGLSSSKVMYNNALTVDGTTEMLVSNGYSIDTSAFVGQTVTVSFDATIGQEGLDSNVQRVMRFVYDSTGDLSNYNPSGTVQPTSNKDIITGAFNKKEYTETFEYTVVNNRLIILFGMYSTTNNCAGAKLATAFNVTINNNVKAIVEKRHGKIFGQNDVFNFLGETLYQKITKIPTNKIVSIMGDSISTFDGYIPSGNTTRYPQSNLLTDVNLTWWKRIIDEMGLTLGINDSWASSRVSWDGTTESENIGANKHMASDFRIGRLNDNGTPDIIFFFCGTNDVNNDVAMGSFSETDFNNLAVNTFSSAYATTIIRMQKAYPKAKIICLTPMYADSSLYTPSQLNSYISEIERICAFFGTKFVDLRKSGITPFNTTLLLPDTIHPNADCMKLMADYIISEIKDLIER